MIFVLSFFEWPFYTGFTVDSTYLFCLFELMPYVPVNNFSVMLDVTGDEPVLKTEV